MLTVKYIDLIPLLWNNTELKNENVKIFLQNIYLNNNTESVTNINTNIGFNFAELFLQKKQSRCTDPKFW